MLASVEHLAEQAQLDAGASYAAGHLRECGQYVGHGWAAGGVAGWYQDHEEDLAVRVAVGAKLSVARREASPALGCRDESVHLTPSDVAPLRVKHRAYLIRQQGEHGLYGRLNDRCRLHAIDPLRPYGEGRTFTVKRGLITSAEPQPSRRSYVAQVIAERDKQVKQRLYPEGAIAHLSLDSHDVIVADDRREDESQVVRRIQ